MVLEKPLISKSPVSDHQKYRIIDLVHSQLSELFFLEHPSADKNSSRSSHLINTFVGKYKNNDVWVYYPWHNVALHTVSEDIYYKIRTSRNKNYINAEEQANYHSFIVGIIGLSVGACALHSLVLTGGPKNIKISDHDELEVANLNRVHASLLEVGQNKAHIAARRVWEMDPFVELQIWDKGINGESLDDFIISPPRIDVLIDAMDDIELKIKVHEFCSKNGMPVLMATDVGDGAVLQVERFDLEPGSPIFNGRCEKLKLHTTENLDRQEWLGVAEAMIGPGVLSQKMSESLREIGKSLGGIPQLGTAASIAGAMTAYAVRKIANKGDLPTGRYRVDLDQWSRL